MHEASGWLLDAASSRVFAAAWVAVVIVYGFWRSRGMGEPDAIRQSGPIF